jgi:hypothetical protein
MMRQTEYIFALLTAFFPPDITFHEFHLHIFAFANVPLKGESCKDYSLMRISASQE